MTAHYSTGTGWHAGLYEMVFAACPVGLIVWDRRARIMEWNPAAERIFGWSRSEAVAQSSPHFLVPEAVCSLVDALFVRLLEAEEPTDSLNENVTRDGRTLQCEWHNIPMRDADGCVQGFVSIVQDISDQRRAEEALQGEIIERQWAEVEMQRVLAQSEQVLAAITSILIGVDQNGRVSTWNTAARRAFGMEMHEVVGQPFEGCGIAWDWAAVLPAIAECSATHRPVRLENVQYDCGGRECFLGVTINPISGYSDFPVGFLLLAADITERRQTERALREREATLRRSNSVLQAQQGAAPDGILVVDENRRIVDCNRRFLDLWQIPKALSDSRDDHAMLSYVIGLMRDPDEFLSKVLYLYDHPTETSRDELHLKDGRVVDRYSGPVRSEEGQDFGRIWYFHDITARKVLESQLSQAQKLESIGHLAAGIAHELNTPIQYVGDNVRFLQDAFADLRGLLTAYGDLTEAAKAAETTAALAEAAGDAADAADLEYLLGEIPNAITQSLDGIRRVAGIVRAMKEFSHPGAVQKTAVDLNRALESTATVARHEWKYVAELVMDFDPTLPPVPCLPGELNQVFLNVIVNATHAIGDVVGDGAGGKGTITVATRAAPPVAPTHVEVRITDTGTGIRPEVRSKIFDPFFTTKGVGRGTGQGLAIARGIVADKHGGTIACESEVGQGTTFIIRLPLLGGAGEGECRT